ncbi:putative c6 transcription factor [Phaeomoniella chlamydospora]|uniref:Putative c6 transcription factor n=1 Tax=Phaeomoniella chlamydospora TaxID=158046 RepID=A0A0G2ER32_PHACM|nr:putative c6 transcription factor [Phaeomoniella chlamydospora]
MNKGGRNIYLVYLLPMAAAHGPLMHGILAVSASHLSNRTPPGHTPQEEGLIDHQYTLHALAIRGIRQDLADQDGSVIKDHTVAMNLFAILYTISEGQTNGEYHQHLAAAKTMLGLLKSENAEFCDFIYENITYYATLSTLLSTKDQKYLLIPHPSGMSQTPNIQRIGVFCSLFSIFSRINHLRHRIRQHIDNSNNGTVSVDPTVYAEAAGIDIDLRQWTPAPSFPESSDQWFAAQFCQRATWLYLRRTMIFPTAGPTTVATRVATYSITPPPEIDTVLVDAFDLFENLDHQDTSNCCLLYPVFLLGCCSFEPKYRKRTLNALNRLGQYSGLGNVEQTKKVLEHGVWRVMDGKSDIILSSSNQTDRNASSSSVVVEGKGKGRANGKITRYDYDDNNDHDNDGHDDDINKEGGEDEEKADEEEEEEEDNDESSLISIHRNKRVSSWDCERIAEEMGMDFLIT